MVELVVSDAKFFKSCIDAVSNLVDEGTFEVSSLGLRLRCMDPSQIAMVDFNLPKEGFEKVDAAESAVSIGVNLSDLGKVLARARSLEKLAIRTDEKSNKLSLDFTGESSRHFKLPLLDLGGTLPKEPKIVFDSHAKIRGGPLKEMLKDAGMFSSHVVLQMREGEMVVEAHGDSGDLVIETRKDAPAISELHSTAPSRAMFPFEYLDDITRACPEDETVTLELKSDAPVKVSYKIGPAHLSYYLAPRVENV
ncbi:proliferating cell nuclear antigen (pcna) [Candidatus Micrarchaeota archaeon]|nr:proliferating cell nuclear antigen (pcna) [Candidatus Micrarchaeota archaeon]